MVDSTLFLGAVVAGITQFVKLVTDPATRNRAWVILFAVGAGVLLALVDQEIGVSDVSVAQGVMLGLGAAGVAAVAERIG